MMWRLKKFFRLLIGLVLVGFLFSLLRLHPKILMSSLHASNDHINEIDLHDLMEQRSWEERLTADPSIYPEQEHDLKMDETKYAKDEHRFDDKPIINNYTFAYLINIENACVQRDVNIFMPVHSRVNNFKRRKIFRASGVARYSFNKSHKSMYLFFVGLPCCQSQIFEMEDRLLDESLKYRDIIQINIKDVYHNMSLKAMAVLKWITDFCNSSSIILKLDDDIIVKPKVYVEAVREKHLNVSNFVMSHIKRTGDNRSLDGKYGVDIKDWPSPTYPPYVAGGLIGYPTSTAILLYQQAIRTKLLWLDDVFITGICTKALGIPVFGSKHFAYRHDGYIN